MATDALTRRRWIQFGLGTLLTFVTGVAVGLFLAWSFYIEPTRPRRSATTTADRPADAGLMEYLNVHRDSDPGCQGLLDNLGAATAPLQGKYLAFFSRYATGENEHRIVFVYNPRMTGT